MNTLTPEQQYTWDRLCGKFSAKQMSQAIYDYLCDSQIGEHAYGEDGAGNSMEITWSAAHEEWQVINRFADGSTDIYYDSFWEESFANEDPKLLLDMCERLDLIEELEAAE